MPRKGSDPGLARSLPGPLGSGAGKLPPPLPAGVLPPEDSRLWHFVPRAVQQGEAFIKDDTRDWFDDRERKVMICRDYPDHPRWIVNGGVRARMHNAQIVSEIHMLARISAGRADMPAWVPARMGVRQAQSDLAFRLTKAAREVFIQEGRDAMVAFATKAPGQFIKFIGATFIPKQIEANVSTTSNVMDAETADALLAAISEELKRRQDEAQEIASARPLDYDPPVDIVDMVRDTANAFHMATEPDSAIGSAKSGHPMHLSTGLTKVVDMEADVESETPAGEYQWD
ncbi:MAG: hypothetical protein IPM11_01150 [Micropruina sp.]|nr:hypothetical protein [Micropruina sp.]